MLSAQISIQSSTSCLSVTLFCDQAGIRGSLSIQNTDSKWPYIDNRNRDIVQLLFWRKSQNWRNLIFDTACNGRGDLFEVNNSQFCNPLLLQTTLSCLQQQWRHVFNPPNMFLGVRIIFIIILTVLLSSQLNEKRQILKRSQHSYAIRIAAKAR